MNSRWTQRRHRQPPTQVHLCATPGTKTRAARETPATILVTRVRSETDRRRYDLTITREGERVLERFDELAREVDEDFYGVLSPAEQKQLEKLMAKLVSHHFAQG